MEKNLYLLEVYLKDILKTDLEKKERIDGLMEHFMKDNLKMKKLMVLELRYNQMEIYMKGNLKIIYIVGKESIDIKMETVLKVISEIILQMDKEFLDIKMEI